MRPDATILCYPVITGGEKAHKGSFIALTGIENENDPLWEFLSLEKQVDADTPPAFLWHCFDDDLVPVENSIYFAEALRKYDIPFEMHIYPKGGHGASINNEIVGCCRPAIADWVDASIRWMKSIKVEK
jgi:dipeptidyl aminopeptidase/acylaminoacyl peptidase